MAKKPTTLDVIRTSPQAFRCALNIDGTGGKIQNYAASLADFQKRDFAAMDPMFQWAAGVNGALEPVKKKAWIQRARGHSKTTDIASELVWLCVSARKTCEVIIGAADRDQARLMSSAINEIISLNPWLVDHVDYTKYEIRSRDGKCVISVLSADANSSFGFTPHMTIADEFTHWGTNEKFWSSVFSSSEKKKGCLVVACNAGSGKDWKFNVREGARTSPQWHFSAPEGCIAPWFDRTQLDAQQASLPPTEYERLWLNKWQESGGEFVSLDEALACVNSNLTQQDFGVPGIEYVATIDYAEKHDFTVGCVAHIWNRRIVIDRMDVEMPRPGKSVKTSWVKNWIQNIQERFGNVRFIVDPYQLVTIVEDLTDEGYDIERFEFSSGKGNYQIGQCLRQGIIHNLVEWPPHCGAVTRENGQVERMEDELASLVVKPMTGGKWRFDHLPDNYHHDDRAFVLALATFACFRASPENFSLPSLDLE
jgi:hypothetical protein